MRTNNEDVFAFLLNELTPIQAEAFESDLFLHDVHFEELLAFEGELIDASYE